MLLSLTHLTKVVILFSVGLFLIGILAAVAITFAKYLKAQASGSPVVQIESVKIGNDEVSGYLTMRAKELGLGVHLDALYEVKVPPLADNFGSGERFKLPDDLKIEIQGVNVPTVIKAVLSILPDDNYKITAQSVTAQDSAVQLHWTPPTGKPTTWLLRPEKSDGTGDAANKRMIDRVISTILYHMYYDPNGPKEWRNDPNVTAALSELAFPSARALEAFFVGQQYLNAYLRNPEDPAPLSAAESEFRRLQKEMPEFVSGLMLLGVTLSEERNEADAIIVYERAERLLDDGILKLDEEIAKLENDAKSSADAEQKLRPTINARKAAKITAKKSLFQAKLFQANAYRKLYRWEDLVRAIAELDEVDAALIAIEKAPLPGSSNRDRMEFRKIRAVVLSETANALGYGLILLYPESFIEKLKNLDAPSTIQVLVEHRDALKEIADDLAKTPVNDPGFDAVIGRRNAMFKTEMDNLAGKQKEVLGQAREAMKNIESQMPNNDADKDAWDRERRRIESLLLTAEGYGIFRHAQLGETDKQKGDTDFIEQCRVALDRLRETDAQQPNQYIVLQNMGMVYGDPRFDVRNDQIAVARRYFDRSLEIKPNDYFGHQNLALLAVRQAYASGIDFVDATLIDDAIKHAKTSLDQRPNNGTAVVVLSQLYALSWARDQANGQQWEARFRAALTNARQVGTNPVRISVAGLQWGLLRLRASTPDESATDQGVAGAAPAQPGAAKNKKGTFTFEKEHFTSELKNASALASGLPGWEAQQLRLVVKSLSDKVSNLTADNRDTLTWPSSPLPLPQ